MKKKFALPILLATILLTLACGVGLEGISFGDEQERINPIKEMFEKETMVAMLTLTEESGSALAEATSEPKYQSVTQPGSDMERTVAGSHEYSVIATNFECTCQATANMTVDFNFTGDQVEITNGGGGATMVYEKISENQYQNSSMGYYILSSGEGDQTTQTKVEEENRTLINLNGNGYVMEFYKGSSSTPCCFYTFKIEK
ncbi:MAG: hypothetical protein FD147_1696 [Chloroflexi bacterium]|nr:MAG: hypothetical protein FD147_1696 [Chloroflexota bacterium]MBA4376513.1 hypothetical protein [Anaerolinea sp.]